MEGVKHCMKCGQMNPEDAERCSNCDALLADTGGAAISESTEKKVQVEIVDVSIPFWSLVVAAIPAAIIVILLFIGFGLMFGGLITGCT